MTTLELVTFSLRMIGAASIAQEAEGEDFALALQCFNLRGSNWNTRQRFKRFERMQTFPVITSAESYTIGVTADSPDFTVAAGKAPVTITHANWIVGSGESRQSYELEVIEVQEYRRIYLPGYTSDWPCRLYYQRTPGNGTLWPVPVPTSLVDSLQLFWWDQFTKVEIADIATELAWPEGYELAFVLTLAEDICLPFGKTRSDQLRDAAGQARADLASTNVKPPRLDTTGVCR